MLIVPTEKRFDWQHAPVTLFFIVLINCVIFFFYQSADTPKMIQAAGQYHQSGYLELEWPQFEKWLSSHGEPGELAEYRALYDSADLAELSMAMLMQEDFYRYLKERPYEFLGHSQIDGWSRQRGQINDLIQSVSYLKFGLTPKQLEPFTLISHQFMHGDTMHLLGNLFFLIVCGFAVEAAIGHLRFLLFYLVSGVAGGLLYSVVDLNSTVPLVGASGAISGVMAMYVAAFRLRKIEFFYWFFVLVGYFRAPALVILPFFIGKELLDFYTNTGSNVAYMAHTGGFIGGALLIGVALLINPKIFNEEYLDEDQSTDPFREKLARVYAAVEKYRFATAATLLTELITEHGSNFELEQLRYQLLKLQRPEGYRDSVLALLRMKPRNDRDQALLATVWADNPEYRQQLEDEQQLKLAMNLACREHLPAAESIFQQLHGQRCQHPSLGVLARKLSLCFEQLDNRSKKYEYETLADSLLMGSVQ